MSTMLYQLFNPVRMLFVGNLRKTCAEVDICDLYLNDLTSDDLQLDSNPLIVPPAAINNKRDLPSDTCLEPNAKRRRLTPREDIKRALPLDTFYELNTKCGKFNPTTPATPPATSTPEDRLDQICKQFDNCNISEPVEQICTKLNKLKISKQSAKATKAQQPPVPMEIHDPMDWEEWTPEDTVMGGESNHLKRSGEYLLFEQPSFKRRRRFGPDDMHWQTS